MPLKLCINSEDLDPQDAENTDVLFESESYLHEADDHHMDRVMHQAVDDEKMPGIMRCGQLQRGGGTYKLQPNTRSSVSTALPIVRLGVHCVKPAIGKRWIGGYESLETRTYSNGWALKREVRFQDMYGIRCCVARGVDLSEEFPDGSGPPLVEAASQGNAELVQGLLELRADPSKGNSAGYTPLMAAVSIGAEAVVQQLLEQFRPRDVCTTSKGNQTALAIAEHRLEAAREEQPEMSRMFRKGVLHARGKDWASLKRSSADLTARIRRFNRIKEMLVEHANKAASDTCDKVVHSTELLPQEPVASGTVPRRSSHRWWLNCSVLAVPKAVKPAIGADSVRVAPEAAKPTSSVVTVPAVPEAAESRPFEAPVFAVPEAVKPTTSAVAAAQEDQLPSRVVGFDFDCTLTVKHFFKVFAWGYANNDPEGHPHVRAFVEWCNKHGVRTSLQQRRGNLDIMCTALEDFCAHAGEDVFKNLFREIFLGGEERIKLIESWLRRMRDEARCSFAIVTAGTSAAVLRGLATCPEWLPFFPSNRVWDVQQGRHTVSSVMAQKALILRDVFPDVSKILLVDDSSERDAAYDWVLKTSGVEVFKGSLLYEGPGVSTEILADIEKAIFS